MTNGGIMTEITNDISTRLLAQENLLINRAPVQTASFDVKSRILTLPMWKNMTPVIEEMLKAHEVGHALYTNENLFTEFQSNNPKNVPFGYLNVLEDVRIEKLMKRKYPGLRKTFTAGYSELNERNFFAIKNRNISDLLLIDRINLWYKVGFKSGVKFTVSEKYLVDKIDKLESVNDVIALATSIYDFVKRENDRKRAERENDVEYKKLKVEQEQDDLEDLESELLHDSEMFDDDDWASDADFSDPEENESDDEEDKDKLTVKGNGGISEANETPEEFEDLESQTANAFARALAESADTSTEYVYVNLPSFKNCSTIKVDYKTVLRETTEILEHIRTEPNSYGERDPNIDKVYDRYESFKNDTSRIVNYLIKEFEMKKAASDYKRQSVAKTGVLDTRKLASYKIREDLFKQITVTKDGFKHGMVFTIDWSGSMSDYLEETVKQLISLVTFCYRAKIPFEVYAFSDNCNSNDIVMLQKEREEDALLRQANTVYLGNHFKMIELFNSKATLSEFQRMCRNLYVMSCGYRSDRRPDRYGEKYQLNGTPLNEAIAWLYDYLGEFKTRHQIEKLTMIKLTDGDGGGVHRYIKEDGTLQYVSGTEYRVINGKHVRIKQVGFILDKYTKKTYAFEGYQFTNSVCKMIQDRHDAAVVGYHVIGRGRRELMYTVDRYGVARNNIEQQDLAIKIRKGFNDEMFFPVNLDGHDELFLLPNTIKVDDTELEEDMSKLTSNQIARKFGKYLGAKKTSRVLLNRFVAAVA
jgi:hypothetical protein